MSITHLEPQNIWKNFAALNAVPRPSKKEERVIAFIKNFGENLGLPTSVDEVGNVIIKKPATAGMENRQTVVLQSHLDMVCQKNNDVDFDFDTQGIEMYVDGDWVKAKGTTLGADNGLGVAAIMSILESTDIAHPAIEALFTIDEETGMTGALGLKPGQLTGEILLNLDTEEDDEDSDSSRPTEKVASVEVELCEEGSDIIACQKLGEVDKDQFDELEVPKEEDNTAWSKEDLLPPTGVCPAPRSVNLHGHTISMEYTAICGVAERIRAVVLAVSMIAAGLMVVGSLRR